MAKRQVEPSMIETFADFKENKNVDRTTLISVLEEGMKGTMADYTIGSVTETLIMDVFPFSPKEKTIIAENQE